jgi:fumarate hydratase class II
MGTRTETDSMGPVVVAADRYWGAQTERSLNNFPIGRPTFVIGRPIVRAFGILKRAAAQANARLGELDRDIADLIVAAADEVAAGDLDDHFPLVVFQTGSGTQTNMNANEVIANRAIEMVDGTLGSKTPVHPNDHVNRGQSSNDTFPTAMHVAICLQLRERLYPDVGALRDTLATKAEQFHDVVTVGRTHLQDATPITLGQMFGGWVAQLDAALADVHHAEEALHELAIGGTAVGTGLNAHPEFGDLAADRIAAATGIPFRRAEDPFAALSAHDPVATLSGMLRTLAGALMKIANDVRWLASGPRNGIGELVIPANEPGSSIMPGKVNPTQAEALTMVVTRVYGNDTTTAFAASQGNFQLNVFKPVMAHAVLESIQLLSEGCLAFEEHCARGIEADHERIAEQLARNLMLVTALNNHIGYDAAAAIAKKAHAEGTSLRDAALALGAVSAEDFDRWVDPAAMTHPD